MVTLLIVSAFFLVLFSFAIFFWQKFAKTSQATELPPQPPASLFTDFSLNELRVNELRPATVDHQASKVDAETFQRAIEAIRAWQASPNRKTATELLHVAAMADDAKNYGRAIELVLMSWRDRSLSDISASELKSLINSEYWVLSSHTRTTGAGFVLKQTLSNANQELESTNNPT